MDVDPRRQVLSYASPLATPAPAAGAGFEATFAQPPVLDLVMACACGALLALCFAGVGIGVLWHEWSRNSAPTMALPTLLILAVLGVAAGLIHVARVLLRHRGHPVTILAQDGRVTVSAAGPWGLRTLTFPIAEVTSCKASSLGRSVLGPRQHILWIGRGRWSYVRLCVACDDAHVVRAAAADLWAAAEAARARPQPAPQRADDAVG